MTSRVGASSSSRIGRNSQRVHVHDAIDAFLRFPEPRPTSDRPKVIAEVKISGRLDAGEDKAV